LKQTLRLALFGDPVAQSLSPRIHRQFGRQLGWEVDYQAIQTSHDQLAQRLDRFALEGGQGANLTVPLKHFAIRLCRQVDRGARQARAVNTLSRDKDGWSGYNTDGEGLVEDLKRLGWLPSGRRVLILGAGGAVAGLLGALLRQRPSRVVIANRTIARAERLVDQFAHLGAIELMDREQAPDQASFDLLIQATSLGHQGVLPQIRPEWFDRHSRIYDLNYGAAHAALASWCRERSLSNADGIGMLVAQAALAFEIWTGKRPAIDALIRSLSTSAG